MIFKAFLYVYILQICKENMFSILYLCSFMCILYLTSNLKISVDNNLTEYNCDILVALTLYSHLRLC